jgi:hypothetical protein
MEDYIDLTLTPEAATLVRASFEYAFWRGHSCALGGQSDYAELLLALIRRQQ